MNRLLVPLAIALHVMLGVILTWLSAPRPQRSPPLALCLCVLYSQAGLLGIWGVTAITGRAGRLAVFVGGAAILTIESYYATKINFVLAAFLVVLAMAGAGGILRLIRRDARILRVPLNDARHATRRQFTISQMLFFTAAVALWASVGRWLQILSPLVHSRVPMVRIPADDYLVDMVAFSVCSVPIISVGVWAVLGTRWPWARHLALLFIPLGAGMLPIAFRPGYEWWIFIPIALIIEVIAVATLLPVRWRGYQFVTSGR